MLFAGYFVMKCVRGQRSGDGYEWVFSSLRFTVFVFDFSWSLVGLFLQESMQCGICVCLDPMRNDEDKCRLSYYFMLSPMGDPDPGDGLSAYNQ